MESQKKSEFETIMNDLKDIITEIKDTRKEFQSMREFLNDEFTKVNEKLEKSINTSKAAVM
nr:hypothetical protein [uncultured Lysinibacillus sp.]